MSLPERTPLPPRAPGAPSDGGAECRRRGYCGPFLNQELYDAFPDPMWHGFGECLVCRSTRLVAAENAKRQRVRDEPSLPPPEL